MVVKGKLFFLMEVNLYDFINKILCKVIIKEI